MVLTISTYSPPLAGTDGSVIDISGTGFTQGLTSVKLNNVDCSSTILSSTQLTFTIPTFSPPLSSGNYNLTITNPGEPPSSASIEFIYYPPNYNFTTTSGTYVYKNIPIPQGATNVQIKAVGGGGGASYYDGSLDNTRNGGNGGTVISSYYLSNNDKLLNIYLGGGGGGGGGLNSRYGGGGGGLTQIISTNNINIIAGGGGGGSDYRSAGNDGGNPNGGGYNGARGNEGGYGNADTSILAGEGGYYTSSGKNGTSVYKGGGGAGFYGSGGNSSEYGEGGGNDSARTTRGSGSITYGGAGGGGSGANYSAGGGAGYAGGGRGGPGYLANSDTGSRIIGGGGGSSIVIGNNSFNTTYPITTLDNGGFFINSIGTNGGDGYVTLTFSNIPTPSIDTTTPLIGYGGMVLDISGSNFNPDPLVYLNDVSCTGISRNSPMDISCILPLVDFSTNYTLSVFNPGNNVPGTKTNFSYIPIPSITTVDPSGGKNGTIIDISGKNFIPNALVYLNDISCTGISRNSSMDISCILPLVDFSTNYTLSVFNPGNPTIATKTSFSYIPTPSITAVDPSGGKNGTVLDISGKNFIPNALVYLNDISCTGISRNSPMDISCILPLVDFSTNYTLSVFNPGNNVPGSKTSFSYIPTPSITAVDPSGGKGGTIIDISGKNFNPNALVYLNDISCTGISRNSPMDISCILPLVDFSTNYTLSVFNPGNTVRGTKTSYSYIPTPSITTVDPLTGKGGTVLNISGKNFNPNALVYLNDVSCTGISRNSPMDISCILPLVDFSTNYTLSIFNPGNPTIATKTSFSYFPTPSITSFTPLNGTIYTPITITGTNLICPSIIMNNIDVRAFGFVFYPPPVTNYDTSYNITITNPGIGGQSAVSTQRFTYNYPPAIASISPIKGPNNTLVTINGSRFVKGATVAIGTSTRVATTYVSPTKIQFKAPSNINNFYNIIVTNPDLSPSTQTAIVYTYTNPVTITNISLSNTPSGVGNIIVSGAVSTVYITGTNFMSGATVTIGTTSLIPTIFTSSTKLSFLVPTNPSTKINTYKVKVTNPFPNSLSATSAKQIVYPKPQARVLFNQSIIYGKMF